MTELTEFLRKNIFLYKITSFYYKQIRLKKSHIVYLYIYIYHIFIHLYHIFIYSKKIQFFRLTELAFSKIEIRIQKINKNSVNRILN